MTILDVSEKTHIRMTFAHTISFIGAIVVASAYFFNVEKRADEAFLVAEAASSDIKELTIVVRVESIRRDIKDLQSELRQLRRLQQDDPNDNLIQDQIQQVEFELSALEATLRCYRNASNPERCEQ